jgi:adenylate cyclase
MADIFLSYASDDRERIAPLVAALERQGWSVWWDRSIPPGRNFDEVLEEEIDAARCVVVMWTEASIDSQWVRSEALEGMEREILVPVRLDDVRLPFAFRRVQTADLLSWPDGGDDGQYGGFISSVAAAVGVAPEEHPTPVLDRPSLAVLPFTCMSADPNDEYLADGLVEDLITSLSSNFDMFVIARNSSFAYKSRPVDVRLVGRELGVSYVVEGSIRRTGGEMFRITAQLIETSTGTHLWAQKYDRSLDTLFDVQDQLVAEVASATNAQVFEHEVSAPPTLDRSKVEEWRQNKRLETDGFRGGTYTPKKYQDALREIDAAIELSPDNVVLVAHKARILASATTNADGRIAHRLGVEERDEATETACALARKAIQRAPQDSDVLAIAGFAFHLCGRFDEGIPVCERALRMDPRSSSAQAYLGQGLILSGRDPERGLRLLDDLLRHDPLTPLRSACFFWQGIGHSLVGDAEAAVAKFRDSIRVQPLYQMVWITLAMNLVGLERSAEARAAVEEAQRLHPGLTLETVLSSIRHSGGDQIAASYADALTPLWKPELS